MENWSNPKERRPDFLQNFVILYSLQLLKSIKHAKM